MVGEIKNDGEIRALRNIIYLLKGGSNSFSFGLQGSVLVLGFFFSFIVGLRTFFNTW